MFSLSRLLLRLTRPRNSVCPCHHLTCTVQFSHARINLSVFMPSPWSSVKEWNQLPNPAVAEQISFSNEMSRSTVSLEAPLSSPQYTSPFSLFLRYASFSWYFLKLFSLVYDAFDCREFSWSGVHSWRFLRASSLFASFECVLSFCCISARFSYLLLPSKMLRIFGLFSLAA